MLKEIMQLFKPLQNVQLATCEKDQPRLRPMTLIVKDGRFYFATDTEGGKSSQIAANPKVECCLLLPEGENTGYLRLTGVLEAETCLAVKKDVADFASFIYHYWHDPADPGYCLWELRVHQIRYIKPGEDKETLYNI